MGKKKTTHPAVAQQPTKKVSMGEEQEKLIELCRAKSLIARRYWDDENATVNDVLERVRDDMYTIKNILGGISLIIYETNIEGPDCLTEEQQTKIMLGIHETLELLVTFIGERMERSADVYTDHLPARKKEGRS